MKLKTVKTLELGSHGTILFPSKGYFRYLKNYLNISLPSDVGPNKRETRMQHLMQ